MTQEVPFNSFTRELNVHLDQISYNEMAPPVEYDEDGNEVPHVPQSLAIGPGHIYRLLSPYL